MSRATEITTSLLGDVTNARDKQTALCPLLISNYWTGGCCEFNCAWFYCLLRSYKSTLQLCRLSEHVDVAFIESKMGINDSSATAMYFERFWFRRCTRSYQDSREYYIQSSLYMCNMLLRRLNIRHMRNKWRAVNIYILSPVRQF